MAHADEQSYEEMISALRTFVSQIEEECVVMEKAGEDCVDNTDGDKAAIKSSERLKQCAGKIRSSAKTIREVATAVQKEIENIRKAAAKANQAG